MVTCPSFHVMYHTIAPRKKVCAGYHYILDMGICMYLWQPNPETKTNKINWNPVVLTYTCVQFSTCSHYSTRPVVYKSAICFSTEPTLRPIWLSCSLCLCKKLGLSKRNTVLPHHVYICSKFGSVEMKCGEIGSQ